VRFSLIQIEVINARIVSRQIGWAEQSELMGRGLSLPWGQRIPRVERTGDALQPIPDRRATIVLLDGRGILQADGPSLLFLDFSHLGRIQLMKFGRIILDAFGCQRLRQIVEAKPAFGGHGGEGKKALSQVEAPPVSAPGTNN